MSAKDTQNAQLLEALEAGRRVTALSAFREFHSMRLAARIYDLRQQGYDIKSERRHYMDDHGSKICYNEYYMNLDPQRELMF